MKKKKNGFRLTGFPEIKKAVAPHTVPCPRQVYATVEVAENTARLLKKSGILAHSERCKSCGLIHLVELWG